MPQLDSENNTQNKPEEEGSIEHVNQDTSLFTAFKVSGFPRIWGSILSGNSGRYSVLVVAGWEAYKLTHSAFWSSIIAFCILVPVVIVGPIAGAYSDRFNKTLIMALGQSVATLSTVLAIIFLQLGTLNLTILVITTLGVGIGNAIQNPAWSSLVPAVIGVKRMVNGGAMVRIAQQGSEFLGPLLATPILVSVGPSAVYALSAVFYLIGTAFALSLKNHIPFVPANHRGIYHPIKDALIYVSTRQRILGALLILVAFHCGLTMAYTGIIPKLAEQNLHGSSGIYGDLLTAVGVGAILGAIMVIFTSRWLDLKLLLATTGIISGLSLVLLGFSTNIVLSLLGAIFVGASQSAFMALYLALLQGTATPEMRGRVAAFSNILVGSTMSSLALLWGGLTNSISVSWVMAAPGLLFVAILLMMLIISPWLRPDRIRKKILMVPAA